MFFVVLVVLLLATIPAVKEGYVDGNLAFCGWAIVILALVLKIDWKE